MAAVADKTQDLVLLSDLLIQAESTVSILSIF